jgi:hypothetical protein
MEADRLPARGIPPRPPRGIPPPREAVLIVAGPPLPRGNDDVAPRGKLETPRVAVAVATTGFVGPFGTTGTELAGVAVGATDDCVF